MKVEFVQPTEWNKEIGKLKSSFDKSNEWRVDFDWNFKNSLTIRRDKKKSYYKLKLLLERNDVNMPYRVAFHRHLFDMSFWLKLVCWVNKNWELTQTF